MNANALVSLVAGTLFGAGLVIGGMTDPGKVIGFLDLAGRWDPSLAFVMGTALCVTLPVFQLVVRRRSQPLLDVRFHLPTKTDLDPQLIGGAVLFGIGWGIAGLCPGPAIASLVSGTPELVAFVAAMMAGMWLHDRIRASGASAPPMVTASR
jgi:uncharacterized protein